MKRAIILFVIIATAGSCLAPKKKYIYQSFQIVYHSDTRGYVQPCG
ncbi:MAG: hypothetical protein GTO51_09275 [Candidatus Latescibacteria bacterium]|nr:hypothetical protein [Candidatus Latescibacterota bacterium]NIM66163.1 hypothetical protein [Candidatus Latescibacterota bacterium]NIO02571.1 hypothetical protein [Candidatus Latescibacterota bacterium]NIO29485.1 hypothetical protein [Candidatus Latescibacterota bacterium]NIO57199.1 hypothetical protein [Candidatus Latescibacterota bacterium]